MGYWAERKLLKLCRAYGLQKDRTDIRIERIRSGVYGGVVIIYRAVTPEMILSAQMAVGYYADQVQEQHAEQQARLIEKDPKFLEGPIKKMRDSMLSVFGQAVLWPDLEVRNAEALADHPEIGPALYAEILSHSNGGRVKKNLLRRIFQRTRR